MSADSSNPDEVEAKGQLVVAAPAAPVSAPASASGGGTAVAVVSSSPAAVQLSQLPHDEMVNLAEDLGLDPTQYRTPQELVAAVHDRRQLIAGLNRDAMLDVVRWGRRPVSINAVNEQIALEISRIRSMRFAGLSHRGLVVLAKLRGVECGEDDAVPQLIKKLKRQEGFFTKLNRKRRAVLGGMVAKIVGDNRSESDYKFLPPGPSGQAPANPRSATIKDEIEESGLFGGIGARIKKTADHYLNQKLDEIESRIDRKLDEIDRRLAEWRDREIANRIRILKITLWASVIVGVFSLIYAYVTEYIIPH
jgi:hypothetical protein